MKQSRVAFTDHNEDTSATFDEDRYDDYGDENIPNHEPTTIYRGPSIHNAVDSGQRSPRQGPHHTEAAFSTVHDTHRRDTIIASRSFEDASRSGHASSYDRNAELSLSDGEDETDEINAPVLHVHGDDSTSVLFKDEDRSDMRRGMGVSAIDTPSKPPQSTVPGERSFRRGQKIGNPQSAVDRHQTSSPVMDVHRVARTEPARRPARSYDPEGAKEVAAGRVEGFYDKRLTGARWQRSPSPPKAGQRAPAAKVSASQEVSEDEQQPLLTPQSQPRKRAFHELDYEIDDLQRMSYADLDEAKFLSDPRKAPASDPVDQNAQVISLSKRLESLGKMNADDQKSLFRSLNDEENEEAGRWFVQKFGEDLKRLMQQRLERRKMALKYEMQVKRRQKAVETKSADIQADLDELKKGGGSLLQGRASPAPKAAGAATPRNGV
jgi:hypothetical protein